MRSPGRQATRGSHVIYVDSYPVVVAHSRALLAGDPAVTAIAGRRRKQISVATDGRSSR